MRLTDRIRGRYWYFSRPYAQQQTLTLRQVIARDIAALSYLLDEPSRFFAWYASKNRWFVFSRLEVYLDGFDVYSQPTKFGIPFWALIGCNFDRG